MKFIVNLRSGRYMKRLRRKCIVEKSFQIYESMLGTENSELSSLFSVIPSEEHRVNSLVHPFLL